MLSAKQQLYDLCTEYVLGRIQEAEQAIADTQESVANETKSSAGDKYETSREMMQQDINRDTARLYEMKKLQAAINQINPQLHSATIQAGSIVHTDQANYYLCISAGQLKLGEETYQAISVATPIGQKMLGLKEGDTFEFNGRKYTVRGVA